MARKNIPQRSSINAKRIIVAIALLLAVMVVGSIIAAVFGADTEEFGANTAVIRIIGPIASEDAGVFDDQVVSSTSVVEQLRLARDDDMITGVILEIDSPGGSAVASDEIAQAVKDVRASGKPVVAWIRESGASGAYWIASASDHIVANRMSITGSIGVYGSYMGFERFIDDWNVSYNRLVSGDRKDIGDPFTELTPDGRLFLQRKLDRVHGFFIEEVARNRNMSEEEVRRIADGSFYLGVEAKEAGLVDELGGEAEAIAWLEGVTGEEAITTVFEEEGGFMDELFGIVGRKPSMGVRDFAQQRVAETVAPVPMLR